jgi:hypothetical protein
MAAVILHFYSKTVFSYEIANMIISDYIDKTLSFASDFLQKVLIILPAIEVLGGGNLWRRAMVSISKLPALPVFPWFGGITSKCITSRKSTGR